MLMRFVSSCSIMVLTTYADALKRALESSDADSAGVLRPATTQSDSSSVVPSLRMKEGTATTENNSNCSKRSDQPLKEMKLSVQKLGSIVSRIGQIALPTKKVKHTMDKTIVLRVEKTNQETEKVRFHMKQAINKLKDENESLKNKYEAMIANNPSQKQLTKEVKSLKNQKSELILEINKERKSAETENRQLTFEMEKMKTESVQMKGEIDLLGAKLRSLTEEKQTLAGKLQENSKIAEDATAEKSKLITMLQSATTKRNDVDLSIEFPNGTAIIKQAKASKNTAKNIFMNLSDLCATDFLALPNDDSSSAGVAEYTRILDLLALCAESAENAYSVFVNDQGTRFAKFLNPAGPETDYDNVEADNSLESLMWISNMQKTSVEFTKTLLEDFDWSSRLDLLMDTPVSEIELWALSSSVVEHEEMEGESVALFMRHLVELLLYARFSQPRCFLHPKVADTVRYDPIHYEQAFVPINRTKAKAGDTVHVVYPGLYFGDPHSSKAQPVVKGLVVLLPSEWKIV